MQWLFTVKIYNFLFETKDFWAYLNLRTFEVQPEVVNLKQKKSGQFEIKGEGKVMVRWFIL